MGKTIAEKAQTLTEKLGFTALDNNSQSNDDMSEYSSHQEFYFRPVTEQETLEIVRGFRRTRLLERTKSLSVS